MPDVTETLKLELATYFAHKAAMLASNAGRWVLIKGNWVIAYFDTQDDAIQVGYRKFGNVPFLTRQVLTIEPVGRFSRDLLARPAQPVGNPDGVGL